MYRKNRNGCYVGSPYLGPCFDKLKSYQCYAAGPRSQDDCIDHESSSERSSFAISKSHVAQVARVRLPWSEELSSLCHRAKNLYNAANYELRNQFFTLRDTGEHGEMSSYYELDRLFKNHDAYKALNSTTAQDVLKYVDQAWKSYWESRKVANQGQRVGIPGYQKSNGEFVAQFTWAQFRNKRTRNHLEENKVKTKQVKKNGEIETKITSEFLFPKKANISPVRFRLNVNGEMLNTDNIKLVRIVPRGNYYIFEVIYEKKIEDLNLPEERVASVDLGVSNLLTIVNNVGLNPVIVKGGKAKFANYNAHLLD